MLGIRPDSMSIGANSDGGLTAQVEDVDALIGETSVTFQLTAGGRLTGLFADGADSLVPGQVVHLEVSSERVELFDSESEQSLRLLSSKDL